MSPNKCLPSVATVVSSSDKASGHRGRVQGTPTVVALLWPRH